MGGAAAAALMAGARRGARRRRAVQHRAPAAGRGAERIRRAEPASRPLHAPTWPAKSLRRASSRQPNAEIALAQLLDGTGLTYRRNGDTFLIVSASDPQSGSAAGDGADGTSRR